MSRKAGCPFNNFGLCLKEKCMFFMPNLDTQMECAITGNTLVSDIVLMNTEMILEMINLIAYGLYLQQPRHISDFHYRVLNRLAFALSQLESSPGIPSASRKRLTKARTDIWKILEILFPDNEDDDSEG